MRLLLGLIRFGLGLAVATASTIALVALLGFAVPLFDLFNHLQLLLFLAALVGVAATLIVFSGSRLRTAMTVFALLGLAASASVFVPEFLSSLQPRPALPAEGRPVLRLMTHNIFGLNYDLARANAVITAEDPDIIAFQEYFSEQANELHPLLKARYPYSVRCKGGRRANIGLYSKIPFDKAFGEADCPDNARGNQRTAHILATFTLEDGTVFSVLTSHLDWPLPTERQQAELAELAAVANSVTGPLIVVGDFNSTPWSYALRGFAAETGLERQTRNLVTYPIMVTVPNRLVRGGFLATVPFLPLDQVFTRGGVAVHELHSSAQTGSDHLPVTITFSVSPPG